MTTVVRVWRQPYELKDISLKTDKLSAFLRPKSNLFVSMIVDDLYIRRKMFSTFLVEHTVRLTAIKLKKKPRMFII